VKKFANVLFLILLVGSFSANANRTLDRSDTVTADQAVLDKVATVKSYIAKHSKMLGLSELSYKHAMDQYLRHLEGLSVPDMTVINHVPELISPDIY